MRIFCRRALGVVFDRLENRRVSKIRRSLIDGSGSSFRTHHLDVVELRIRNFVGCHPRFLTFKALMDKPFRMRTLWTLDHRFHCEAACEWVHDCMFLSKECGPVKDLMATKNAWCGNIVATTARVRHSKEITNSASKLSSLCTSAYNTSIAMSTFARAPNAFYEQSDPDGFGACRHAICWGICDAVRVNLQISGMLHGKRWTMKFPASSASGQNIGSYGFDHAEAAPSEHGNFLGELTKDLSCDFGYWSHQMCWNMVVCQILIGHPLLEHRLVLFSSLEYQACDEKFFQCGFFSKSPLRYAQVTNRSTP